MRPPLYQQTTATALTQNKNVRMLFSPTSKWEKIMGTGSSFTPFHESVIPAIESAATIGALKRLTCLCRHTAFPNENGEPAKKIAQAIFLRAAQLKAAHRDSYFAKIENRLRQGNIGTRPFHVTICDALGHVQADTFKETSAQLTALGDLIMTTRIPKDRKKVREAFSKKTVKTGFCSSSPGFCNEVFNSLDAQRLLDEEEMRKAA